MSVLKYKDPISGEWVKSCAVKNVEAGGEAAPTIAAEQLKASGYPDYIQPEVMDMVVTVDEEITYG